MRPQRLRSRALLRAAVVAVAASVPVLAIAWLVRSGSGGLVDLDERVVRAATDFTRAHPAVEDAALAWQAAFQPGWVFLAGGLVCLWAWRRHGLGGRALWAIGTTGAAWLIGNGAKTLVDRARPVVDDALTHAPGASFPSGHCVNVTAGAAAITLLVWPLLGPRGRVVVPAVGGLVVLTTAVDRVLLGAHFPSDTVAGILLGGTVVAASYVGYEGWGSADPPPDDTPHDPPPHDPPAHDHPAHDRSTHDHPAGHGAPRPRPRTTETR